MFRIDCNCGEALMVAPEAVGGTIVCWKCGLEHSVPEQRLDAKQGGTSGGEGEKRGRREASWLLPTVSSAISIILIAGVLVWALSASGGGDGLGVDGEGLGPLAEGDGSGTGKSGEGSGEGATGAGTGGAPASPATAPSDNAATRPRRKIEIDLPDIVETPPPPPVPDPTPAQRVGDPGREGAAGGGGGGGGGPGIGARGDVSFTLSWTYDVGGQGPERKGGPDIDIWVMDPLGQRINTSDERPIRRGPTQQGGRADRDDQGGYGPGDGGGPERIFWPDNKSPSGTYRYGIRWFNGVGSVEYVVRVYLGKELVATKTGTLTSRDINKNIELGSVNQDN